MPPDIAATKRLVFLMRIMFAVSGMMFAFLAFRILHPPNHPVSPTMQIPIAFVALFDVFLGFVAPGFLAKAGANSPAQRANPVSAWFSRCIISLAFFESCSLFAFVLRQFGGNTSVVALLFTVGIASTIFWNPGQPPSEGDTTS